MKVKSGPRIKRINGLPGLMQMLLPQSTRSRMRHRVSHFAKPQCKLRNALRTLCYSVLIYSVYSVVSALRFVFANN